MTKFNNISNLIKPYFCQTLWSTTAAYSHQAPYTSYQICLVHIMHGLYMPITIISKQLIEMHNQNQIIFQLRNRLGKVTTNNTGSDKIMYLLYLLDKPALCQMKMTRAVSQNIYVRQNSQPCQKRTCSLGHKQPLNDKLQSQNSCHTD